MFYPSNLIFLTMYYFLRKSKNSGFKVSFRLYRCLSNFKVTFYETYFETLMKLLETYPLQKVTSRFHKSFILILYKSIKNSTSRNRYFSMKPDETFKSFIENTVHRLQTLILEVFEQMKLFFRGVPGFTGFCKRSVKKIRLNPEKVTSLSKPLKMTLWGK